MAGLVATTMTSTRFTRFSRRGALQCFYYFYVIFYSFFRAKNCIFGGDGGAGCVQARKFLANRGIIYLHFPSA